MKNTDQVAAELKFLTAIYAEEVFLGRTVRQEKPMCCGKAINPFVANVHFREATVGTKIFHLLEPHCPVCGRRIQARFSILS